MRSDRAVTRMSSDRVEIRPIVNRLADRRLWNHYLPLRSVTSTALGMWYQRNWSCLLPPANGSHVTITHGALELTIRGLPLHGHGSSFCTHPQALVLVPDYFKFDLAVQPPPLGSNYTGTPTRHVQTCSLWNTYWWQAGGWHSTWMLSCFTFVSVGADSHKGQERPEEGDTEAARHTQGGSAHA